MILRCLTFGVLVWAATEAVAPGQGVLGEANEVAGVLVMERLRARDPRGFGALRRCPPRRTLLVNGRHDHTDQVLRRLGVRFRSCSPEGLARTSLTRVRLLILDCPGKVGRGQIPRIRGFVARGGTLMTTDWALLHVIESAFPGTVVYNHRPTRDDVVRISSVSPDPLVRWMFPPECFPCWWLEDKSYPVRVLGRRVKVLLGSDEMARKYGAAPLAVTFRHGRGRVVHVVSHTYLQRNRLARPWERKAVSDAARLLDLPVTSRGYRRLRASGALGRVRAGDLNAALSAHQLLVNVMISANGVDVVAPSPPPAPPSPGPAPKPPPSTRTTVFAMRDAHLLDGPDGAPVLRVSRDLRLRVLGRRGAWVSVATPAGQRGWIAASDVTR